MGTFYQSLRRWFGATGTTGQQAGIQYGEPFTRVSGSSGVTVPDYGIDGSLQVASVWSAMELLTDNIASLPIFVYKKNNNSPNGYKDLARDGSLYKLLHDSPNRRMTPMEFWQFMAMNFLLRGNAFARVVRNDNGEPIELWPMASDQVEIEVLKDRSIVYKYIYESVVVVYGEDSVFHWKEKGNGTIGMSRLDFMRQTVGQAVSVQNNTTRTYNNGGKRPGVFMLDKTLTAKQRDQIRANFSDLVEGNNDQLMVLEAGAKFEALGMSPSDMQLDTTRRFTVEEVARWFGISGVLINDTQKATTWGTGVESIIEAFYKFRLRPMLVGLEQAIELRILSSSQRARYEVEVSLDALLRGSLKERLETGAKAVQNGLIDRNEWRQMENLPPKAGGDVLTVQSNLIPIDKLGKMPANGAQNADQTQPVAQ